MLHVVSQRDSLLQHLRHATVLPAPASDGDTASAGLAGNSPTSRNQPPIDHHAVRDSPTIAASLDLLDAGGRQN